MDDPKQSARLAAIREIIEMLDGQEADRMRPKEEAPEMPPEMGAAPDDEGGELPIPEGEDSESIKAKLMALLQ